MIMSRGEQLRQSLRTFSYTHLRVKHGESDVPYVLEQIRTRKPDVVLLECAGLTVRDQSKIDAYIQSPSSEKSIGFSDPFMDLFIDSLKKMHAEDGVSPRVRIIDYTATDKRLDKYDKAIGAYQNLLREYEAEDMSFDQACAYTQKTLLRFRDENTRREEFMASQILSKLEGESMRSGKEAQSQSCMIIAGMMHRKISDPLRMHKVHGEVVAQEKPMTLSFINEYFTRLNYGEPVTRELLENVVFERVFSLFAQTFSVFTNSSDASRNGYVRRSAHLLSSAEKQAFYTAMLRQDKPAVVQLLKARGIATGTA